MEEQDKVYCRLHYHLNRRQRLAQAQSGRLVKDSILFGQTAGVGFGRAANTP
jgi:hypothetical protein